jgi:hypothetical protein
MKPHVMRAAVGPAGSFRINARPLRSLISFFFFAWMAQTRGKNESWIMRLKVRILPAITITI